MSQFDAEGKSGSKQQTSPGSQGLLAQFTVVLLPVPEELVDVPEELVDVPVVCPPVPVLLEVSWPVCPPLPPDEVVCKSKHPPPTPSMMGADKPRRSQLRASIVFGA